MPALAARAIGSQESPPDSVRSPPALPGVSGVGARRQRRQRLPEPLGDHLRMLWRSASDKDLSLRLACRRPIFGLYSARSPFAHPSSLTYGPAMAYPITGPDDALVYRITHVANLPWILHNGLHCRSSTWQDPNFRTIGLPDLIHRRTKRPVPIPPGGTLSDYVPFYFTSRSPMLYNIKTGYNVPAVPMSEIMVIVTSLRRLEADGVEFVFTDRHAKLATARFSSDLNDLDEWIDWDIIGRSDFAHSADDPGKKERYQAEALIYEHLDVDRVEGIVCSNGTTQTHVQTQAKAAGVAVNVGVDGGYFF